LVIVVADVVPVDKINYRIQW